MNCIYCREDSSNSLGVPHVFPEAFGKNELILPLGAVCDRCNGYLGHELDSVFVSHPIISFLAQFLQLPGKTGKVRKRLGNVATDALPRRVTLPCAASEVITHPDGSKSATVQPLIDPAFDFQRFRRALFHIGLNAYAHRRGAESALHARFDDVRSYIREPLRGESWPFAQYMDLGAAFSKEVTILVDDESGGPFVGIALCAGVAFGVDLLNGSGIEPWISRRFPPGTTIIRADHRVPRAMRADGPVQYRVTIFLDE